MAYIYTESDYPPLYQSMRRLVESDVRLSAWNYLFPASQADVLAHARTSPQMVTALAYAPSHPNILNHPLTYTTVVERGRRRNASSQTARLFSDILDTLYREMGERPIYSLYASPTIPSPAFAHQDDPAFRPGLRPGSVESIIRQMTPGHVFLARVPSGELTNTAAAESAEDLSRVLGEYDAREGFRRLALLYERSPGKSSLLSTLSRQTGADADQIARALEASSAIGTARDARSMIRTVAHEFAHANIQPVPPIATSALFRMLRGKTSPTDVAVAELMQSQYLDEALSDTFAAAVSLDPEGIAHSRYAFAAASQIYAAARRNRQELKGWKYGDPFKLVVMDPKLVEDVDSPLGRLLRDELRRYPLDKIADVDQIEDEKGELNIEALTGVISRISGINSTVAQELYRKLSGGTLDLSRYGGDERQLRQVIETWGSRLWSTAYMIGKASPELIGKEIEVTPEGVFMDGEKLDLAKTGIPDLDYLSLTGRGEMHPEQLERAHNALEMYRRAKRALLRGKRLVLQAGMAATEIVQSWRREFGAI